MNNPLQSISVKRFKGIKDAPVDATRSENLTLANSQLAPPKFLILHLNVTDIRRPCWKNCDGNTKRRKAKICVSLNRLRHLRIAAFHRWRRNF